MDDLPASGPLTAKGPHPWLGPILSIIAIGVAVVWAYLQMRHWKEPEADYVGIATNITVTMVLWVVLVWAIIATYRFRKSTPITDRPVIKPLILLVFTLFAAVGLGSAWYTTRHYEVAQVKKASPPSPLNSPPSVSPSPLPAQAQASKVKPKREAKAKSDNATPPRSSGTVGTITNTGPCPVFQVGGVGNQATGGNCGPPDPTVTMRAIEHVQPKDAKHPQTAVEIYLDHALTDAKFAAVCDRPCDGVGAGGVFGFNQATYGKIPDHPEVAAFIIIGPNPFPSFTKYKLIVESQDDTPVKVLRVQRLTITNETPR